MLQRTCAGKTEEPFTEVSARESDFGEGCSTRAKSAPCVLLGVTGCIGAYKACEIVRGLQKAGVRVKVVVTEHACKFVDPTTFRALTREPVAVGLFDEPGDPIHHISLAQECDAFLIAPCTANVAAKLAAGIADDLLTTTALATTAPLIVAPAMNVHMYEHPATQANLALLKSRGALIIEAEEGYLACGDTGKGRLAGVEVIVGATLRAFDAAKHVGANGEETTESGRACESMRENTCKGEDALDGASQAQTRDLEGVQCAPVRRARDLEGVSVLVTAGPTVEPIDAVRYLSNHSSGKMGFSIAKAAEARGAKVTLVTGPVSLPDPKGVNVVRVTTAQEMLKACLEVFPSANLAVFSAAVADMRPAHPFDRKLKKGADLKALSQIELVENPDILATCAAKKQGGQAVVGFAAETDNVVEHAREKLSRKGADFIVANRVGDGLAFGTDDNEVFLVSFDGATHLPLMPKDTLAEKILDAAKNFLALSPC